MICVMLKKEIQFFLNEISQSWLGEFLMSLVIKKSILEKLSFSEDRSCSVRMCGRKPFLSIYFGLSSLTVCGISQRLRERLGS